MDSMMMNWTISCIMSVSHDACHQTSSFQQLSLNHIVCIFENKHYYYYCQAQPQLQLQLS